MRWENGNDQAPLSREELHQIAVRRQHDGDVKTLLLEIRRLYGVLVRAHELAAGMVRYTEDTNERAAVDRLAELFEIEPAIVAPPPQRRGKPQRAEPEQCFPHMSERDEKRLERDKRG